MFHLLCVEVVRSVNEEIQVKFSLMMEKEETGCGIICSIVLYSAKMKRNDAHVSRTKSMHCYIFLYGWFF